MLLNKIRLYHTGFFSLSKSNNKWTSKGDNCGSYNIVSQAALSSEEEIDFYGLLIADVVLLPFQGSRHTCINIWCPYCHEQLLHTVRRHAVQVRQMQLEVHLIAEDVLAEGTADDRLH